MTQPKLTADVAPIAAALGVSSETIANDLNAINFKVKYITEGLAYLIANWAHMSQWEQEWINAVRNRPPKVWSVKMYNKLHQIVEEAKGNIPRKRYARQE